MLNRNLFCVMRILCLCLYIRFFCFSSRRRHTRCALVTGVQTCALPICRSADILSAELLSSLSLSTLTCDVNGENCTVVETLDSAPGNDVLRLALLGLVGGEIGRAHV